MEKLKNRDYYLNQLISFKDTSSIKIVTGIRRCGKSKLLDLMINYLLSVGIKKEQIIKINFESLKFSDMRYSEVYDYIISKSNKEGKTYIFLDEPQLINGWEKVVNSLREDIDSDIYITGSNSHMLSSEYSTLLSGRYVEIKMLPLSFKEFLDFRGFTTAKEINALGINETRCYYKDNSIYDINDLFDAYLKYGGMPGISELPLSSDSISKYLDSIYTTVINNDILQREQNKKTKIVDPLLLKKISVFLADNIGKEYSYNKIAASINENQKNTLGNHKITDYIQGLLEAFVFYEAKRYDMKGKALLKTNGKFYIVDLGIKNHLLGYTPYNRGFSYENLVYFELLRRGYDVSIGKIGALEVDFRAVKNNEITYFQVTESLMNDSTRNREIHPFQCIDDHYDKIILSLDKGYSIINGIKVINLIDWLLQ